MNIGIDIDDTTITFEEQILKYAEIYNKGILGKEIKKKNIGKIDTKYYLQAIFGWDEITKFNFFDIYYKNAIEEGEILPDAAKTINELKREGNNIYFISSRLLNILGCDTEKITKDTLEKENIQYNELIVGINNKLEICKEKEIDIFIDDSLNTCLNLQENGIKTYLMTTSMNKNINSGNIERVNNWKEILNKLKKACL